MNFKIIQAALVSLMAGCAALMSAVEPKTCQEPPETFGPTPLITCGLPSGEPNVACCAYGQFENGSTSGKLCFHVLCKQDACGDYTYVETLCVEPETPGVEVQRSSWRPERQASVAP